MRYFDNSATTYPKPECVYKALDYANRNLAFNAGRGQYSEALSCSDIINETRSLLSNIAKASPNDVTLLSSATEALNIIINGLDIQDGDNIYISPFEHNAIVRPLYHIKEYVNFNIILLPFDKSNWKCDEVKLKNMFALQKPRAVFMSSVSNVTGYILPSEKVFREAKKYNALTILDSAQSFGILPVDKENVDFIVFAGHKTLYASFGIAGFINYHNIKLKITKAGGNGSDSLNHLMPQTDFNRYEAGSPNIVAIYGLNASIKWLNEQADLFNKEKENTIYLINKLKELENIKLYLPDDLNNLLGIVSINVEGYSPEDVATILNDEFNICVRSGYHCAPFVHDFINSKNYGGTVRISMGAFTTKQDIDFLIEAIETL